MPVIGTEVHSMHPSLNIFKNNNHIYGDLLSPEYIFKRNLLLCLPYRKRYPKSHILYSPYPDTTKVNGNGPFIRGLNANPKLDTFKS